jgi:hypothetical protein
MNQLGKEALGLEKEQEILIQSPREAMVFLLPVLL